MSIVQNYLKNRLDAGELCAGLTIQHWRQVNIAQISESLGFHWVFIDVEHNSMDIDTISQICTAALGTRITPICRVPSHLSFHATRLLDTGAMGVIVPHISTVEEAHELVNHTRFAPIGQRSVTGAGPQLGFRAYPRAEQIQILNRNTFVIAMVESPEGIANAENIAAVEGIDALFVGAGDLSMEYGVPGQPGHPKIDAAFDVVCGACKKHGKHAGMGGVNDPATIERYVQKGVRFFQAASEISLFEIGAKARFEFINAIDFPGRRSNSS